MRKGLGFISFLGKSKDIFFELFRLFMSLLKCLLTIVVPRWVWGDTSLSSFIWKPSSQNLFTCWRWAFLDRLARIRDLDLLFHWKDFVSEIGVLFWKFLNRLSVEGSSHEVDLFILDLDVLPQLSYLSLQRWNHNLLVDLWWISSRFWT